MDNFLRALPNLATLAILCEGGLKSIWLYYGPNNLVHLLKLQSLTCMALSKISPVDIAFPHSLKKLSLSGLELPWETMTIICSLPNLEVLKLHRDAFTGLWEPTEGEFCRLKFLKAPTICSTEEAIPHTFHSLRAS